MPIDTAAGTRTWGVLGVPSSVAAHWPGIEQGPAALREGGLLETLRAHGVRVADHGDLAVARWTADRTDGRPNAWRQVVEVVDRARSAIADVVLAGQAPLVLGGECTLAIALVAAVVEQYGEVGLIYVDGGQDLMIPVDHPHEPILDAMGVAHMLDLPGCVPELAGIGPRQPLLESRRRCLCRLWRRRGGRARLGAGTSAAGRGSDRRPGRCWSTRADGLAPSTSRGACRCRRSGCSRLTASRHRHVWDRHATGPCGAAAQDSRRRPSSGRHDHCRSQPGSRPRRNFHPSAGGSARGSACQACQLVVAVGWHGASGWGRLVRLPLKADER